MTPIESLVLEQAGEHAHLQLAVDQSALHIANLALARWRGGDYPLEALPTSCRARWLAEANCNFTRWLADGGFTQAPAEVEAEAA